MLGKDTVNRDPAVEGAAVFRTIIDSIPAAVFVFQGERMCYVNSSAQSITGYSRAELLEMPFWTVVHPDFQGLVRQRGLDRQTGDAVPADYEVKVVRKDGESIWVKFRASIIDLDGQSAVLGLAEDITERKLAEDRLQQGQRVFELLADYNQMAAGLSADAVIQKTLAFLHDTFSSHESSIAIIEADQNSFFLQSSSHQAQLELDQGRLIPLHATILAEVIKSHQPRYRPDIEGEHSMYAIDTQLLKNGFRSDFLVPLWVEDTCLGTLNMCRSEIDAFSEHERRLVPLLASRLAQALHNASLLHALRASEEQYRTLVEDSPDMIHSLDSEGRITSANAAELETMGYSQEEYIGKSVMEIVHPDSIEATGKAFASILDGRTIKKYETSLRKKSGEKICVEVSATPQIAGGKVIATRAIIRDITARKLKEEEACLRMQRLASQRTAIVDLSTSTLQTLEVFLQKACEISAKVLAVERVSIWLLSRDCGELRCLNLFQLSEARHSAGTVLRSDDYPNYFAALTADRAVEAHDARSDPRTCEFTEEYLIPLGITSMLDVPIRLAGKMVGVLCHEYTEDARKWTDDELGFACDVADQVAQSLINEERKQAEQETKASHALIASIIENAPARVFWKDCDSRYLGCNIQFAEDAGCTCPDDLIGKTDCDLGWKDQAELYRNDDMEVMESGIARLGYEEPQTTPEGKLIWLRTSKAPLRDADGHVIGVLGIYDDITERKLAEEALHDSRARLAEAQRIGRMGNWEFDVIHDTGLYSEESSRIFGVADDYGKSFKSFFRLVHPDDKWLVKKANQAAIETGNFSNVQYRIIRPDGSVRFVQASGEGHRDKSGRPCRIFGTIQDITERKQAELLIEQTAGVVEMVATGQPASSIYDAIALMYEARHPGMRCSMLELKGDKLMHGGAPSLPEAYCNAVHGLQNGPNIGSCGTSTYTGKRVLVEDIATDPKWAALKSVALPHGLRSCWSEPIKSAAGEVLGAFGMYYNHPALPDEQELLDLSSAAKLACIVMERERREAQVRKLSNALTCAGGSIIITNRAGIIEYVNPAFTKITGYSTEDAMGQTLRILNSGNQNAAFYERMWQTITRGDIWNGKVIDKRKDGSFFPAMLTIAPIADGQGVITHFVGSHADISELEDVQAQFHQAQKMEALGTLVGGIAHNFNNTLAGMTGHLYLAKKQAQDIPAVVEKLAIVEKLSFRAADMIQQLLTFARRGRVSMKRLPLSPFIKETLKFLRSSVPESIKVEENICEDDLPVSGDATQIHQVLMNLINNACDAVEGVHMPVIAFGLEAFHVDDVFIENHPGSQVGDYAHLSVKDNGCGIAADLLERIFEPFFTTKAVGRGTGLGLAMIFGAVKTHQGFVTVDSMQGRGSTFHIYLPLLAQEDIAAVSVPGQGESPGQGELILLVDDEVQIIETGKEVLKSLGYRVITATNGRQAVAMFNEHFGEVRLCILDVVMPAMSGVKVAQSIRRIQPHVKVIFSSGYDRNFMSGLENEVILCKPFYIEEMSRLIRKQLDS